MDQHPFRSARLIYRAIEDTDEDADFVHSIHTDPFAYGNSNYSILRPQSKKNTVEGFKRYLASDSNLIGVLICLPADETATDPKPTPIGAMSLSQLAQRHAHHRDSSIGLDIVKAYQGKGMGPRR